MQKIAIISDIHGNLPALKAVLNDIEKEYKADKIFCLGDLVDALPWHNEVIDILRLKQIPTVMGNHDERIALDIRVIPMAKHTKEETNARISAIGFTKNTITQENKDFLLTLPKSISVEYAQTSLLLVHGSPRDNRHYIFEDHDDAELKEWIKDFGVDAIISGHTHLSYIKTVEIAGKEKLWVNVGSVGRSKEKIGAKAVYLQLTIDRNGALKPLLRKIDYDVQEAIEGIKSSSIPDFYASFFEKHLEYR